MKKKILSTLLVVSLLVSMVVPAGAMAADMTRLDACEAIGVKTAYAAHTGTVTQVSPAEGTEGKFFVFITAGDRMINFIVDENTFVFNGKAADLKVGDRASGIFNAALPITMIYPEQRGAIVLVLGLEEGQAASYSVFTDDAAVEITPNAETEIVTEDGKAFDGEMKNRTLLSIYNTAKNTDAAEITPEKIVVLFEKVTTPIYEFSDEEQEATICPVANMDIVVDNVKIDGPAAFIQNGVVMVPLRAVAEALGYTVTWEAETQTVFLDNTISFSIDKDAYNYAKMQPISLGQAPVLNNGSTFVPLSFFTRVAKINNAFVFEGQIDINNGEKFE